MISSKSPIALPDSNEAGKNFNPSLSHRYNLDRIFLR